MTPVQTNPFGVPKGQLPVSPALFPVPLRVRGTKSPATMLGNPPGQRHVSPRSWCAQDAHPHTRTPQAWIQQLTRRHGNCTSRPPTPRTPPPTSRPAPLASRSSLLGFPHSGAPRESKLPQSVPPRHAVPDAPASFLLGADIAGQRPALKGR